MNVLTYVLVFLSITLVVGHRDGRFKNLEKKLREENDQLRNTFRGAIDYAKEEIIADLKTYVIPDIIRRGVHGVMTRKELGMVAKEIEVKETEAIRRSSHQLRRKLQYVTAKLAYAEQERQRDRSALNDYKNELMKLRNEVSNSAKLFENQRKSFEDSMKRYNRELHQLRHEVNNTSIRIATVEDECRCVQERNTKTYPPKTTPATTPTLARETTQASADNFSLLFGHHLSWKFFEVELTSMAIQPLPIRTEHILDVVFNHKTGKIIWSTGTYGNPGMIFSAYRDGTNSTLISRRRLRYMAIDSARGLLFGYISESREIVLVDLNNGNDSIFPSSNIGMSSLSLHTERQLLFAAEWDSGQIIQLNYSGTDRTVLLTTSKASRITTDESNDDLYFSGGGYIKRYSLRTSEITPILRRSGQITRLLYFRNLLFISVHNRKGEILNLKANTTSVINAILKSFPPAVCFIPRIS